MKRILWLFLVLPVAAVVLLIPAGQHNSAQAESGCLVDVQGTLGMVICGGDTVGQVKLPTITVSAPALPAVTLPPVEVTKLVKVPGPTKTVDIFHPPIVETKTVEVPGPVVTKYVSGPIVTITEKPKVRVIRKTMPLPITRATTTVTITQSAIPQVRKPIVENHPQTPGLFNFGHNNKIITVASLGFLAILGLAGLVLLGLYGGYILGYKDSERQDTNFMSALRDQILVRDK